MITWSKEVISTKWNARVSNTFIKIYKTFIKICKVVFSDQIANPLESMLLYYIKANRQSYNI